MRTMKRGTKATMVQTASYILRLLSVPHWRGTVWRRLLMGPLVLTLVFGGVAFGQDYYGNQRPGSNNRPQSSDRDRAERDYIVQENDPYLAPRRQISPRQQYCRQLEGRLARDWINKNRGADDLPRIKDELRKARRYYKKLERRAERKNCYEYFLFSKTVRRTRRCIAMDKKIKIAQRKFARLEAQHQRLASSRSGSNFERNELIASLARNGCGQQYKQAARKNSWGIFDFLQEDNTRVNPRGRLSRHHMPFATYRTMCVRLCDGYYYPVSFSAMQSKFGEDNNTCQSKCAAPAKLFVYENPGGSVETMTSMDGISYNELPNAWSYRKNFIKGCSCKLADYDPNAIQNFERQAAGGDKKTPSAPEQNAFNAPNIGNNARTVTTAPAPQKPAVDKSENKKKLIRGKPGDVADAIAKKLAERELVAPKPVRPVAPR